MFDSTSLSDNHTVCGTFSATGCWPLSSQYEIARNIGPTTSGSFSFSFEYASAYNKQAPSGTTGYWNPYPVSGQTTVLASDGSGSGLPYEIVATQPGVVPGETGKIFQVDSFERTVTVANSDGSFHDQLAVGGSRGTVSYVVTSPNAHLAVTSSGAITTVGASAGAALPVGTYTVSGTDSDSDGDTGTWSFTLTVIKGFIIQIPPTFKSVSVANSGGSFADQLNVSGARGTVDYVVTASNPHVNVTPSGLVETVGATVGAPLAVGTYTVSGTDSDAYGDTGTWSYTLTVTKGTIICNGPGRRVTRSDSGRDFDDHLVASGWSGTVTFDVTSPNAHLHISNDGNVTTVGGPLAPGTYTFSGTDTDPYGNAGSGVTP